MKAIGLVLVGYGELEARPVVRKGRSEQGADILPGKCAGYLAVMKLSFRLVNIRVSHTPCIVHNRPSRVSGANTGRSRVHAQTLWSVLGEDGDAPENFAEPFPSENVVDGRSSRDA